MDGKDWKATPSSHFEPTPLSDESIRSAGKPQAVDKNKGSWPAESSGEPRGGKRLGEGKIKEKPWTETPADYFEPIPRHHSPDPKSYGGKKVSAAFREVYSKVPRSVKKTGKTGEAKRKMMAAIALNKAREKGARIPKP